MESRVLYVQPITYLQTTPTTCGVACTMMVRAMLQGVVPIRSEELLLWRKYKQARSDIVPVISLAKHLADCGLDVRAYHYNAELFWSAIRDDSAAKFEQEERYADAGKSGVHFCSDTAITPAFIQQEIDRKRLVMCGIELDPSMIKHAVLLYGYSPSSFDIIDPLYGISTIPVDRQMTRMKTAFGEWCISVGSAP